APKAISTARKSAPPPAAWRRAVARTRPSTPPIDRAAFMAPRPSGPVRSTSRARLGKSAWWGTPSISAPPPPAINAPPPPSPHPPLLPGLARGRDARRRAGPEPARPAEESGGDGEVRDARPEVGDEGAGAERAQEPARAHRHAQHGEAADQPARADHVVGVALA